MVRNMPDNARQVRTTKLKEKTDSQQQTAAPKRKLSEYGKQLHEKQRVRDMYGLRERQFHNFFAKAVKSVGAPGENLLSFLERRLDNVLYRLKMTISRTQARQIIVHGLVRVNGAKVTSPSYLVSINDVISLKEQVQQKEAFLEQVVDKRLKTAIKVPEWLELSKQNRTGKILRFPVRTDIQFPVEEHVIVELYSR